jgi:hypothetical protein
VSDASPSIGVTRLCAATARIPDARGPVVATSGCRDRHATSPRSSPDDNQASWPTLGSSGDKLTVLANLCVGARLGSSWSFYGAAATTGFVQVAVYE